MSRADRPLIGITCSSANGEKWADHMIGHRLDYLYRDYSRSVLAAGGLPVGLPVVDRPELLAQLLDRLDGLILSGGPDILPSHYGQEPRPGLGPVDAELDVFELGLTRLALAGSMPILGICRGIQVLAVAAGGTLIQNLPENTPDNILHRQKAAKEVNTHRVGIARPSRLFDIVGRESLSVNSFHHQAVDRTPPGFEVSARAGDGVIEALERPGARLCLGVQWHPEGTSGHDEASQRLFEALVKSAAENRNG